jgi:hypothetical protein
MKVNESYEKFVMDTHRNIRTARVSRSGADYGSVITIYRKRRVNITEIILVVCLSAALAGVILW